MINYNGKIFKPVSFSNNSETSSETIFHYYQTGDVLTATYSGGNISTGQLIGIVDENGRIDMRYQQVSLEGELMTGQCTSIPEILVNGKIRLHETWQWTSGDKSAGKSVLEEI